MIRAATLYSGLGLLLLWMLLPTTTTAQLRPSFTNITTTITQGNSAHGAHGIAFADVDNDGDLEIFVSNLLSLENSTLPDEMYVNKGGLLFTEESVTRGISPTEGEAHAAVFVDVDGDGYLDLFKGDTNGTNELYMNDGRGYFTLAKNAGIKTTVNPSSNYGTRGVGAGDFDGDGHIDLFAANAGQSNELYVNNGDGTFREEASPRGVDDRSGNRAQTQGCAVADYDGDGDLDIFLAKRNGPNRLFRNDGRGNFSEVATTAGVSMASIDCDGGVFGDIDNDGDLDLLVAQTDQQRHGVFRNNGNGTFKDESQTQSFPGQGAYNILLEDLDIDGDLDIVFPFNARQPHRTYLNDGKGNFSQVTNLGYEVVGRDVRCGGFADLDGDGDRDFVIVDKNTFNLVYRNNGLSASGRHWLAIQVRGPNGQPTMPGAWVELYTPGQLGVRASLLQARHVGGGGQGYCRADDSVAYFGVPAGTCDVLARLPSGEVVARRGVSVDQKIVVDPTPPTPAVLPKFVLGKTGLIGAYHPADAGKFYVLMASFATGAIPLPAGDRRVVPLAPDVVFGWSVTDYGNWGPFKNFMGPLDTSGLGVGQLSVPSDPLLVGVTVYFAFITLDGGFPNGVRTVSRAAKTVLAAR